MVEVTKSSGKRATLLLYQRGIVVLMLLTITLVIGGFVALFPRVGLLLVAAIICSILGFVFISKPSRALLAFVFFLPIHSLVITVLIVKVGIPLQLARIVAGWKEALLIGVFLCFGLRVLLMRRRIRLVFVDILAIMWLVQVLLYFLFHDALFDWKSDVVTRLYGSRDWLLYLIPFFIGRFLAMSEKTAERVMKSLVLVGLVTSLFGIVEYVFIPTEWYVELGVPQYFASFLGIEYSEHLSGLPPNYWTRIAGTLIRRAVSTHLTSQGFALPFLILIPVASYNYLARPTRRNGIILAVFVLALLLTITRMTIVVCFVQFLLLMWLLQRRRSLLLYLLAAGFIAVTIVIASPTIRTFVIDTILLQDESSRTRPDQWVQGIATLLQHPLGNGLGSTGQTGARLGLDGLGVEAGYLKVSGALGWLGLLLFLGWFLGVILYSYVTYKKWTGPRKAIAAVVMATAVGFLLNNLTAPPDQSPFVIYIFPWLAGMTIQFATSPLEMKLKV